MSSRSSQRLSADVVVIGGGGSGLAAAIEAARLGRTVILLEKGPRLGGSTSWSVGSISANCTPHQIKSGIKDSPQEHFEDMALVAESRRPGATDNLELRRLYVDNITETFRWLMDAGVEFFGPVEEKPHRYPRMHNVLPNSRAYIHRLSKLARRIGVRIETATRVTELAWADRRVSGLVAESPSGTIHVNAGCGVVIAAGDYSASNALKTEYIGEELAATTPVNLLSTGDGQQLGISAGGRIVHGERYTGSGARFVAPPRKMLAEQLPGWKLTSKVAKLGLEYLPEPLMSRLVMKFMTTNLGVSKNLFAVGGILVNAQGERFTDEKSNVVASIPRQEAGEAFVVFDDRAAASLEEWPNFVSTAPGMAHAYLRHYRRHRKDIYHQAKTWSGLASRMKMRTDNKLQGTIERYNDSIDAGTTDQFGRTDRRRLTGTNCFALGPIKSMTVVTDGGLAVNTQLAVLDENNAPIEGLFAAGSSGQGGVLLEGHGHHIGWAFVSGRLAGRSAAFSRTGTD
jgi:succinate dehydrogenase/fumarate reductase flavoprotein subunit